MNSAFPQPEPIITAAGGILLRKAGAEQQVCIVLRKERKDWTLPKGKLEPEETLQGTALREVLEETGYKCELEEYLGAVGYEVSGIPKVVLFWRMAPMQEEPEALKRNEIEKREWMSIDQALKLLTYETEKNFLAQVAGSGYGEAVSEGVRAGYSSLDRLFHSKRARARLVRESEVFEIELRFLEQHSKNPDKSWAEAARQQLGAARRYERAGEIEGGWFCLHAAQRQAVFGLDSKELLIRAETLRSESKKISSWRAEAINTAIGKDASITAERLNFAMGLRDEYFANQYHKVWLTGDQLRILIWICVPAILVFVLVTRKWQTSSNFSIHDVWSWYGVISVMIFGILGASFSCAQGLITDTGSRSIPQRVADHYVTLTRALSGAIAGLASCAFFCSHAFTIKFLEDSLASAFTIAFIFGYTGEKLIARVANKGADSK